VTNIREAEERARLWQSQCRRLDELNEQGGGPDPEAFADLCAAHDDLGHTLAEDYLALAALARRLAKELEHSYCDPDRKCGCQLTGDALAEAGESGLLEESDG
jgi:hypothetical protein